MYICICIFICINIYANIYVFIYMYNSIHTFVTTATVLSPSRACVCMCVWESKSWMCYHIDDIPHAHERIYTYDQLARTWVFCLHGNILQHTATHCNSLQHTAIYKCYTLQHTAIYKCSFQMVVCIHSFRQISFHPDKTQSGPCTTKTP